VFDTLVSIVCTHVGPPFVEVIVITVPTPDAADTMVVGMLGGMTFLAQSYVDGIVTTSAGYAASEINAKMSAKMICFMAVSSLRGTAVERVV
jgi:hypothetical protein